MQCHAQFLVLGRSCWNAQPFTIQLDAQDVAATRREAEVVGRQASRIKLVGDAIRDLVKLPRGPSQ